MNRLRLYRHSASDRAGGRVRVLFANGWAREWTPEIKNRPVSKFGDGRARTITRSHPEMLIAYSLVSTSVRPTTLSDLAKWAARMDDLVARSEGTVEWGHSSCQ